MLKPSDLLFLALKQYQEHQWFPSHKDHSILVHLWHQRKRVFYFAHQIMLEPAFKQPKIITAPSKRSPLEIHSNTRRKASPGPSACWLLLSAFSTNSSIAYHNPFNTSKQSVNKFKSHRCLPWISSIFLNQFAIFRQTGLDQLKAAWNNKASLQRRELFPTLCENCVGSLMFPW